MTTEIQTRSELTGIGVFTSIEAAMLAAEKDSSIWKISFSIGKERVRLVRRDSSWVYEPLLIKQAS